MAISGISAIGQGLTQVQAGRSTSATAETAPTSGMSFGDMLGQVVNDAVNTIQGGEAAAIQGVTGAMPTFKVVESIMSAQRTLQQALSIRDKAVSAYQEITRMTI